MAVDNPYTIEEPVSQPEGFYGRKQVFREVDRILNHPQSNAIVLFGQNRIGKTSFLLQLVAQLSKNEDYWPVYFNFENKSLQKPGKLLGELAEAIVAGVDFDLLEIKAFDASGNYFLRQFIPDVLKVIKGNLVLLFDNFNLLDEVIRDNARHGFFYVLRNMMAENQGSKFPFVIDCWPEELSESTLSLFKSVRMERLSLLSQKDSYELIQHSGSVHSLEWDNQAVELVWQVMGGHPYMMQLLGNLIWDRITQRDHDGEVLQVGITDVESAVDELLEQDATSMQWLWDKLHSIERVVSSGLAEAGDASVPEENFLSFLHTSGVKLPETELELAAEHLVEHDYLALEDGGYRFLVPFFRRWITKYRPLNRAGIELEEVDPLAKNLFEAGKSFYEMGDLVEAENQIRQAIQANPKYVGAILLLGRILQEKMKAEEAVEVLEKAYQYNKAMVQDALIEALLSLASEKESDTQRLEIFDRILDMQENQLTAQRKRASIWIKRAEAALKVGDLEAAEQYFRQAYDEKRADWVDMWKIKRKVAENFRIAYQYEEQSNWEEALHAYRIVLADYEKYIEANGKCQIPEYEAKASQGEFVDYDVSLSELAGVSWQDKLERVIRSVQVSTLYEKGYEALKRDERKDVDRYMRELILVATGDDVLALKKELSASEKREKELETSLAQAKSKIKELDKDVADHLKVLSKNQDRIEELVDALKEKEEDYEEIQRAIDQLEEIRREKEQYIKQLDEQVVDLTARMEIKEQEHEEAEEKTHLLEDEAFNLRSELDRLKANYEESRQRIFKLEKQITQLQEDDEKKELILRDAEDRASKLEVENENLQEDIKTNEVQKEAAVQAVRDQLQVELDKKQDELQGLQIEIDDKQDELDELQADLGKERKQYEEALQTIDTLKDGISSVREKLKKRDEEIKEEHKENKQKIKDLQKELKEEKEVVKRLREFVNRDAKEIKALEKEIANLNQRLEDVDRE